MCVSRVSVLSKHACDTVATWLMRLVIFLCRYERKKGSRACIAGFPNAREHVLTRMEGTGANEACEMI